MSCPITEQSGPGEKTRCENVLQTLNCVESVYLPLPVNSHCLEFLSSLLRHVHLALRDSRVLTIHHFNFLRPCSCSSFCPEGFSSPYLPGLHQLIFPDHTKLCQVFLHFFLFRAAVWHMKIPQGRTAAASLHHNHSNQCWI